MRKSQLRQIIKEEIQKEMFGLDAYGRGGLSISKYELEKNPEISSNPNNYYVMRAITGSWPASAEVELGSKKVLLQRKQYNDKFAVYVDDTNNFNPIMVTIYKK